MTGLLLLAVVGIGALAYLDAIDRDVLPREAAADIFDALLGLLRTALRVAVIAAVRAGAAQPAGRQAAAGRGGGQRAAAARRRDARGAPIRAPRGWPSTRPRCSGAWCCSAGSCSSPGTTRPRGVVLIDAALIALAVWLVAALARSGRRDRRLSRRSRRVGDRLEQAIEHHADVAGELARGEQRARGASRRSAARRCGGRSSGSSISAVSLYLVAPSVIAALGSWRQIERLSPAWLATMAALQAATLFCMWALQLAVAARARAGSR